MNAFKNYSNAVFTQAEIDLLNKGPTYAPFQGHISKQQQLATDIRIDCALKKLSATCTDHSISELSGALKRTMRLPATSEDGEDEVNAMKSLRDSDARFTKSDKSKRIVALTPTDYSAMMKEHTEDYVAARRAQPSSVQNTFNTKLSNIAKRYTDPTKEALSRCACSEPLPSRLRVLPKDHKDGPLKGRPIVAATDAPATKLSKFLSTELYEVIRREVPTHLDSTHSFLRAISTIQVTDHCQFASLDIVNLYGSIPIQDGMFPGALSVVTDFFGRHKSYTQLASLRDEDFCLLLQLCLISDTIQVDGQRYKQVKGLQMGNNLSTAVAIIFMFFIEKQIFEQVPNRIKTWLRYIDDVFVVFEGISSQELLAICNDVHSHIRFTIEEAQNNALPFLDVLVKPQNQRFTTTLYAKPSHSGSVIPWASHHPRYLLINILKNELRRALRNGSGPQEKNRGTQLLKERYLSFGYPPAVFHSALKQVTTNTPSQPLRPKTQKVFLSLPFISEVQVREVKRAISKCGLNDKLCVSFKSRLITSILTPRREPLCTYPNCKFCLSAAHNEDCFTKCCIYFISCDTCSASYIGETGRTMRSRLREHTSSQTSLVFRHLLSHGPSPDPSCIQWTILHRNLRNTRLRKSLEEHVIRSQKPLLNEIFSPSL